MNDEEWDSYYQSKMDSQKKTAEALESLRGETIESVNIKHSGAEYYTEIIITCTNGIKVSIKSSKGETDYFTDLYARIQES